VAIADPHLRIAHLERELNWAQLKIQVLEERLRRHRISVLGPHSETLSNLQLELLMDFEPGVTADGHRTRDTLAQIEGAGAPQRFVADHAPGLQPGPGRIHSLVHDGGATSRVSSPMSP
jgi:hypothetical protein